MHQIADPDNLRLAFWKAGKGKRYAAAVLAYQQDLDANLLKLRGQLLQGRVEVGAYRHFTIYEPKERRICAAAFDEQVLHHALMNVCHAYFERAQIFNSYASRKGKGTHAALRRAGAYTRKYKWYLKLDVRKFFDSVDHTVLKAQLSRLFKEFNLLQILGQIVDSYEALPERGMPIGNLTSQYFANHYLCGLDHYLLEELKVGAYVRYMDDMVLWSDDKSQLLDWYTRIVDYVAIKLRCELKAPLLDVCKRGAPFLGYKVHPYHIRLLQKSKIRYIRKLQKIEKHHADGRWTEFKCAQKAGPLIAFTVHADAAVFRKKVLLRLNGQST